ncbi:hypothetical protein GEMRC1_006880 [Eukaryota sp. GEM-RC1]
MSGTHPSNNPLKLLLPYLTTWLSSTDSSHDVSHAVRVFHHSCNIIKETSTLNESQVQIIHWAALLHDVLDHKYEHQISAADLHSFVASHLNDQDATSILNIIHNVSYSKQIKGLRQDLGSDLNLCLNVVSDADKIDALGSEGLKRCRDFSIARNPNSSEADIDRLVVEHCKEKLVRLLPECFIITDPGRLIATPLQTEIVEYIAANDT